MYQCMHNDATLLHRVEQTISSVATTQSANRRFIDWCDFRMSSHVLENGIQTPDQFLACTFATLLQFGKDGEQVVLRRVAAPSVRCA
jgi:hypothetical protein